MHSTLTEHARCLYGDEYRPVPECDLEHREHYFVEELTFADADAILAMLRELCPYTADGHLPVWVRNLAYRLVLLQRPDEPALMREAAENLWSHGPDWDGIAAGLVRRADALEAGRSTPQAGARRGP
ncbi:hypothetical protein L7D48_14865 [Streptomyces sp. S1A]|uniref:HEAT repeat domain-containing protein n=1 Tax=Streptomyces chitinivorans TaxID=1257027 RepID=A0ABW7HLY6_9ACTN|nr:MULTISPECIES: hypothetical protein [Streptomyces]MCG3041826.1 hypothetical protein [Streptomyces sp. ICN903]MDH2410462.1 hypothetical protein [Streptomyces chitinivorans]